MLQKARSIELSIPAFSDKVFGNDDNLQMKKVSINDRNQEVYNVLTVTCGNEMLADIYCIFHTRQELFVRDRGLNREQRRS